MRRFIQLLLLISCLAALRLTAQPLSHLQAIVLSENTDQISLQSALAYFRDPLGTRTIADVSGFTNESAFQSVTSPVPNFGVTTGIMGGTFRVVAKEGTMVEVQV